MKKLLSSLIVAVQLTTVFGQSETDFTPYELGILGIPVYTQNMQCAVGNQTIEVKVEDAQEPTSEQRVLLPPQIETAGLSYVLNNANNQLVPVHFEAIVNGQPVCIEGISTECINPNQLNTTVSFFNSEKTKKITTTIECVKKEIEPVQYNNGTCALNENKKPITVIVMKADALKVEDLTQQQQGTPKSEDQGQLTKQDILVEDVKDISSKLSINQAPVNFKGVTFALVPNEAASAQAQNLEQLVKAKGLKIAVNSQVFELMPQDRGTSDRAAVRSIKGNEAVIRVVSVGMQRFFDVTVLIKDNELVIEDIKEISKKEYRAQHRVELGY